MNPSEKLDNWMRRFYKYSPDTENKKSKLLEEFIELRKIIKEIRKLEEKNKRLMEYIK